MKPTEISKGVYSVGVIDWNIRDFHGYSTEIGTTYNAFFFGLFEFFFLDASITYTSKYIDMSNGQ